MRTIQPTQRGRFSGNLFWRWKRKWQMGRQNTGINVMLGRLRTEFPCRLTVRIFPAE
jgi:hypothetical protein